MSSHAIDVIQEYIRRVQRRRQRIFTVRQLSLGLACMVALWMMLGFLEMTCQFPLEVRITLLCILLIGAVAISVWCLHVSRQISIDDRRIAHYVEDHIPELEQRLITSMEFDQMGNKGWSSQLVDQLWEDTRGQLQARNLGQVTSGWRLRGGGGPGSGRR
jgi:hypothetical protein